MSETPRVSPAATSPVRENSRSDVLSPPFAQPRSVRCDFSLVIHSFFAWVNPSVSVAALNEREKLPQESKGAEVNPYAPHPAHLEHGRSAKQRNVVRELRGVGWDAHEAHQAHLDTVAVLHSRSK